MYMYNKPISSDMSRNYFQKFVWEFEYFDLLLFDSRFPEFRALKGAIYI